MKVKMQDAVFPSSLSWLRCQMGNNKIWIRVGVPLIITFPTIPRWHGSLYDDIDFNIEISDLCLDFAWIIIKLRQLSEAGFYIWRRISF